jgi:hypothetical protein
MKSVVMLRTTELLDVFGLVISEETSEVRLVVKDDYCIIQTYSDKELLQESSKLEVLGGSDDVDGVYSYPLSKFEEILKAITKDLEEHNCDITALVFDTDKKNTSVLVSEGRVIIDYLNKGELK